MTTPWSNRDYYGRRAENAAGMAAGGVGIGFGAAKLRDAYKQDYPAAHQRRLGQVERGARRLGPERAKRLVRLADEGHPGFRTLATAAALGTAATTGKRIRMHTEIKEQKQLRRQDGLAKADYGQELGKLPRYAHLKGIGKCRVLEYRGNGNFRVLDRNDDERLVHRNQMQFLKKGMTMTTSAFGVEHGEISKAKNGDQMSTGRMVATGLFAPVHGAVAGRPGKKLRATGNEMGGSVAGALTGAATAALLKKPALTRDLMQGGAIGGAIGGGSINQRKGYYKPLGKSLAPARDVSAKAREKAAAKHDALPDGSFPIQNRAQLMRARRAVGRAKDPAAARALIRRRAAQLHVSLKGSALDRDGVSKSAFGVEHEVSKAREHSDAYKATVWNRDTYGFAGAKENRKLLRRARLKGQAAGLGAGAAGGAAAGAALKGKTGAAIGGVTGALAGQMVGDYKGARKAMRDPRYTKRPS